MLRDTYAQWRTLALAAALGAALGAAPGLALPAPTPAAGMHHAAATPGAGLPSGAIHQEIVLPVPPARVYEALLDSTQFGALTGMRAEIDRSVGGAFRTFDGMIEGRNLELVPGERIVQAWRPHDWPPGVFSVVRFVLEPEGSGTRLILTHSNYEEGEPRATLVKGWTEHYMEPLKRYFASSP